MKLSLNRFPLLLCLLALLAACTKSPEKRSVNRRALEQQYVALRDTLNARWAAMMASDDEKMFYTKRLLQELSYIPTADASRIQQLQIANEKLKARRYAQQTMASDSIDAYDVAQDAVLREVKSLASAYADTANHKIIVDLATEIQHHDDRVVVLRSAYDQAARAYNQWLREHQADVPAAASARAVPLFSISGM